MPIHDWTRVPSGLFHDFHQTWSIYLKSALNKGVLPNGVSALVEQRAGTRESDVLTVEWRETGRRGQPEDGGLLVLEPPAAPFQFRSEKEIYAGRANQIAIKHQSGQTLAIIEIVSPGNKDSKRAINEFVEKAIGFIRAGVHFLVIDLFPPTPRDPSGIHQRIWEEISDEVFAFPSGKSRTLASYEAGREKVAYVHPLAVGDELPDFPLFLWEGKHVRVPLEASYQSAWLDCPEVVRREVETESP
jgi:hypothetical protein